MNACPGVRRLSWWLHRHGFRRRLAAVLMPAGVGTDNLTASPEQR
jgi:hypothetical protein